MKPDWMCLILAAQNSPVLAAIEQRLDTPQIRVIVATLQPRTPSIARNGHAPNRLLICLDVIDDAHGRRPVNPDRIPSW